jgi:hypothetical protein
MCPSVSIAITQSMAGWIVARSRHRDQRRVGSGQFRQRANELAGHVGTCRAGGGLRRGRDAGKAVAVAREIVGCRRSDVAGGRRRLEKGVFGGHGAAVWERIRSLSRTFTARERADTRRLHGRRPGARLPRIRAGVRAVRAQRGRATTRPVGRGIETDMMAAAAASAALRAMPATWRGRPA